MILTSLAVIILVLGLGLIAAGATFMLRTRPERSTTTSAEVLSAEIETYQTSGGDGLIQTFYRGKYLIRYQVGAKVHEKVARPDFGTPDPAQAQKRLNAHAPGAAYPIRYNPKRPDTPILDAPPRSGSYGLLLAALGISFLGASLVTYFEAAPVLW